MIFLIWEIEQIILITMEIGAQIVFVALFKACGKIAPEQKQIIIISIMDILETTKELFGVFLPLAHLLLRQDMTHFFNWIL